MTPTTARPHPAQPLSPRQLEDFGNGPKTKVNYNLGYHFQSSMFGHDGACGTDLSVNPRTGMVAVVMLQCTGGDQSAARDSFLKTATSVFPK